MTTMQIDRAVVEQALEALDAMNPYPASREDQRAGALAALRAALAQQDERDWSLLEATQESLREHMAEIHRLRAALAQQAEPVEPAAKVELMMTGGNAGLATRIVEIDDHLRERLRPGQLLYTAPPQRLPLTDEEIDKIFKHLCNTVGASYKTMTRAIERAHGIGEQP